MSQVRRDPDAALSFGDYALTLAPWMGGAATSLTWRGKHLLRPSPAAPSHAVQTACFAMAPYANRIASGRFVFEGREVRLAPNFFDHKHPLHGSAWLERWRVEREAKDRITLAYAYAPGDWPWPFSCRQSVSLDGEGALFELTIRNDADTPMPLSFGFHPYLPRPRGAILRARVDGVWRSDAEMVPTHFDTQADLPDLAAGAVLDDAPFIDNCHTGWDGELTLDVGEAAIRLTASPQLRFLHLYLPVGEAYLCAEPVSAIPDAFNRSDAEVIVLAPGASETGWIRIGAL
jgi:aldose 1-epimerase